MKLTLCRQPKRPKPWTLSGHNGGSAQGQVMSVNQIPNSSSTACRPSRKNKLSLTTMAELFTESMQQAIEKSKKRPKRNCAEQDTDDESGDSKN
jgi:hypothetical protein